MLICHYFVMLAWYAMLLGVIHYKLKLLLLNTSWHNIICSYRRKKQFLMKIMAIVSFIHVNSSLRDMKTIQFLSMNPMQEADHTDSTS
jgi:hypothetical protein